MSALSGGRRFLVEKGELFRFVFRPPRQRKVRTRQRFVRHVRNVRVLEGRKKVLGLVDDKRGVTLVGAASARRSKRAKHEKKRGKNGRDMA